MKYRVKKDKHDFKPDKLKVFWKPKNLHFNVTFNEGCDYIIEGEDQYDWNKLTGVTYSINPSKKTAMIGWRFNPTIQKIELCAYYHINGGRQFSEPLLECKLGELVVGDIQITKDKYKVTLMNTHDQKTGRHSIDHKGNPRCISRMINPWFGGTSKAPNEMSLELRTVTT